MKELEHELDPLRHRPTQELLDVPHHAVRLEQLRREHLPAAVREINARLARGERKIPVG